MKTLFKLVPHTFQGQKGEVKGVKLLMYQEIDGTVKFIGSKFITSALISDINAFINKAIEDIKANPVKSYTQQKVDISQEIVNGLAQVEVEEINDFLF